MSSDDYAELLTNAGEAGIFTRPADGDAVDDAAERAGMARWSVDLSGVRAKAALLDAIAKQLELPDWFGGNWDALNDSLTDLAWNHPAGVVLTLWRCDAIAQADAAPSFDNTVAAFDRSGRPLRKIEGVFYNLCASESSPELREVEREMAPKLASHRSAVYLNAALFARLEVLHEQRTALGLAPEQQRLLERLHLDFVMAGARLAPAAKARYAEVMQRLVRELAEARQRLASL